MLDQRCNELFKKFVDSVDFRSNAVITDGDFALFHLHDMTQQLAVKIGRARLGITHCEEWGLSFSDLCEEVFLAALALWSSTEPEKTLDALLKEMLEVNLPEEGKGGDYNSGGIEFMHYWPAGPSDTWIMVHGKVLRLTSLLRSGREPNYESISNNCLDLCAYVTWLWVVSTVWKETWLS